MSDIAIRVENLSKQYRIGGPQARYKTIRESLTEAVAAPFRRLSSVVRGQSSTASNETIWALKDVSFEVQRGEVVGIIGRNGAGKTTLLKILCRITEPTEGYAEIHGRVGSLLEVGTGFHPELTGRENITLNGAILGMKRAEIDRKFDEIVDFAEIEKFIDTPAKHYSSGMYVRLAFAVAAHMEPEILLVDEVLAVGDVAFQKKCLGKMGEVASEGRTVLLVSHNMASIQNLCPRVILLESGKVSLIGDSDLVISRYLSLSGSHDADLDLRFHPNRPEGFTSVITRLRLLDTDLTPRTTFAIGSTIIFEIELDPNGPKFSNPSIGIGVDNALGQRMCTFLTRSQYGHPWILDDRKTVQCEWRDCRLRPGLYTLSISLTDARQQVDRLPHVAQLQIVALDIYGTGRLDDLNVRNGILIPIAIWNMNEIS